MVAGRASRPAAWLILGIGTAATLACGREPSYVRDQLLAIPDVEAVEMGCRDGSPTPGEGFCATVVMSDGVVLQFANLGYGSFGPVTSRVRLTAAGRRAPLVVTCRSQSRHADIGRSGLFGHHFVPAIDGVADAIRHRRDVMKELEFWPQCPQFWELSEEPARLYRYCAHAVDGAIEPPPCGQSPDNAR